DYTSANAGRNVDVLSVLVLIDRRLGDIAPIARVDDRVIGIERFSIETHRVLRGRPAAAATENEHGDRGDDKTFHGAIPRLGAPCPQHDWVTNHNRLELQ